MKTKARVLHTKKITCMVAAETSSGSLTLFELLGCEEIQSGDILSGDMEALDMQEIYNETRDEELTVFIHGCGLNVQETIDKHFNPSDASASIRRPMWPIRNLAISA